MILFHNIVGESQQYYGQSWICGTGGAITKFNNSSIVVSNTPPIIKYFGGGLSNICDTNGNILLLSDGYNIYDSTGTFFDGGDTLIPKDFYIDQDGFSSFSQTSIFLPMDSGMYYFVTPTASDTRFADCNSTGINCYMDLLLYNVIDMKAKNGSGKVVKRMIPILENGNLRVTQMMACRHGNGKDWWLLKNEGDSANVHTFLFTQDSVYDKGVQIFNEPVWGSWDIYGQSTFNLVGNQFVTTSSSYNNTGYVFLADFDRCYGTLSNPKTIEVPLGNQHNPNNPAQEERKPTGIAFSPNGQFLYVASKYNIYQYDLNDNTWFHVAGLDTTWNQFEEYNSIYLAPNNKLYIGNWHVISKQMSVIDNPDIKGAGCNFCPRCLRFDSLSGIVWASTPPCMPNYGLGARVCYPEGLLNPPKEDLNALEVFPNPTSTKIVVRCQMSDMKKDLYNSVGQLILSTKENEIDVRNLSKGVYYLRVGNLSRKVIVE